MHRGDASADEVGVRLINRELSWLDFNRRVLAMADQRDLPLLERLRFCSIWSRNLDEFFQVRVAGLEADLEQGSGRRSAEGRTTSQQLAEIRAEVGRQSGSAAEILTGLRRELAATGVELCDWPDLSEAEKKQLGEDFIRNVFPVLTPLAVDPGHPFPYLSTLSLNLGVLLTDPGSGAARFARVKVPVQLLGRQMRVNAPDDRYVPLEQVIAAHLSELFPGMAVREHAFFRVTRDADLSIDADALDEHDADDLLSAVETELRNRRFGAVIRVEVEQAASSELLSVLVEELGVPMSSLYAVDGPLDLGSHCDLAVRDRPDLVLPRWEPVVPRLLSSDVHDDVFSALRQRDLLVHHPYTSFDATVLEFIRQAAVDPAVQAIKITLYRTSGDGRIVKALIRAAEAGKQVVVVVELKARFDEEANIEWARRLERAGVHVTYGFVALKVHSKVALVVRQEPDGLRRYCHIGTGNYNSRTARHYSDLGLMTSDEAIGADLSHLFNSLTGYGIGVEYQTLVVAPEHMRPRLVELVRNEARHGDRGRIVAKMNSLVDPVLIEELYAASQAGVQVDLIVRGICCLRPGVPGLSDNIRVRSILGRYLEHARLYHFLHGSSSSGGIDGEPLYLLGSADLMPRNLNRRIEALVPVEDPDLQAELEVVLGVNLADDTLAWELDANGAWHRVESAGDCNAHERFQQLATS